MFYNIQNQNAPPYLCNLIPPSVQSTTIYPLRNGEDIIFPYCRLSLTNSSFIPATIRQWNNLDLSIRGAGTISAFKNELKKKSNYNKFVPKHFYFGPRKMNILLTQFRRSATFLNYDLWRFNIILDPSCRCGAQQEDSTHFFFDCPIYNDLRDILINELNWLPVELNLNLKLLTSGDKSLTNEQNEEIFKTVFDYLKNSKRFL